MERTNPVGGCPTGREANCRTGHDASAPGLAAHERYLALMTHTAAQQAWIIVSLLGSPAVMTGLCLVLVAVLALQREWRGAAACALIAGLGGLLNVWLKALVRRPRPPGADLFLHGHSWGFPSGHAMGSLIGYGMLCYVASRYWSMPRSGGASLDIGSLLIVAGVGVSRVALGVHYAGDVIGGWVIGAVWLAGGIALLRRIEHGAVRPAPASPPSR